jgi:hypothetical protein
MHTIDGGTVLVWLAVALVLWLIGWGRGEDG